ncbi:hypothetical protein K8354_12735 [Polaribacter litorisediminis]|uniref:hypothetical protein n=1 Tax=Polaribacter litorisediminis TaxID=1908341 RepID=UPI001CBB3EB6|nr:hypothetical protein [Polaribacter litorisediminis]UAM97179.1 hypothetical protein K8354_12735 [Polaribacter litorisediminis]
MKIVKFHIEKIKPKEERIGKYNMEDVFEFKTVGIIGFIKHKRRKWKLKAVEYFIITDIYFFWKGLELSNRIAIIAVIIGIILYILDKTYFLK